MRRAGVCVLQENLPVEASRRHSAKSGGKVPEKACLQVVRASAAVLSRAGRQWCLLFCFSAL